MEKPINNKATQVPVLIGTYVYCIYMQKGQYIFEGVPNIYYIYVLYTQLLYIYKTHDFVQRKIKLHIEFEK